MADRPPPSPMRYASVGLELAGTVMAMALLGYGLDRWLGIEPWGVVIGSTLAIAGGLYKLIRVVLAEAEEEDDRTQDGS